jgi:hypothetical protein
VVRSEVTPKGPRAQHVTARNVIVLQKLGGDWKVSTHTWNYDRPLRRFQDDNGQRYARPDRLEEDMPRDREGRYERRSDRDGWRSGRGDRDYSGRGRYHDHHWDSDRYERRHWRDW